jgi:hypothetical protein
MIASKSRGLRLLVLASAWACALAGILRILPVVFTALHPHAIYFLHAAHILNAAAGPPLQATVTKVRASHDTTCAVDV